MPHRMTTEDYFNTIKHNHQEFLAETMITHIGLLGSSKDNFKLRKCTEHVRSYYKFKAIYLNRSIKQQSTGSKLGHGALSALLGIGAGSLLFLSTKSSGVAEAFNPVAGVNDVASGAFSALIGAGVSVVAYQAWLRSSKAPAVEDFEQFNEAMKKAGFSNDKYSELSAKLVKLFHFRECLLLGLKDNFDIDFKDEFKEKYLINDEKIEDKIIDDAVEVFFLEKLTTLFNQSFKNIYNIHDEEIQEEKDSWKIIRWIKGLFENEEDRKRFTQQLQIQFMEQCLNFLEQQMLEPGYLARYPLLSSSITGLMAGSMAFCIISTLTPFLTFTAINIGLVTTVFSMIGMYYAVDNWDYLKFERDSDNRTALGRTIKHITKECHRLRTLIKNVVETTKEDFSQLDNYNDKIPDKGFDTEFHLLRNSEKFIAIGADSAWAREYAARYRHSKRIEIDLKETNEEIINSSKKQTNELCDILNSLLNPVFKKNSGSSSKKINEKLEKFINDTKAHLTDPKNSEFILKFEVTQKIRQQILDVVSRLEVDTKVKLPDSLIRFYTEPVFKGGLGGSKFELAHSRELAPSANRNVSPNKKLLFERLLKSAHSLNHFLSQHESNNYIFHGDPKYREMLGLQVDDYNVDNKINSRNITQYLTNSFDFLYSLDRCTNIAQPMNHSREFVTYRMLLLKQLSNYVNPSNYSIEASLKKEICEFVEKRIFVDPKVILDDIFNHGLFAPEKKKTSKVQEVEPVLDPLGRELKARNLEFISEAIRVDMAYTTSNVTAKMLLDIETNHFIETLPKDEKILFGYSKDNDFTPESSQKYLEKILKSIVNSRAFILCIMNRNLTGSLSCLTFYMGEAKNQIHHLCDNIKNLIELLKSQNLPSYNSKHICSALESLKLFEKELESLIDIKDLTQIPMSCELRR